ncbi:c-type cytochrome [Leptospirillum ferriphilum]|uniref:Cytochrome C n=1 Tax=Leptospirillum ferriphilum YSK TaxID=1441628 RepID=A0A059XPZ0_9BACT|nr:cytochrome c [Leptospirillum ferriphilum]AIA30634.1 cytochrome C [Leptospirillum ferriphilum YSK]
MKLENILTVVTATLFLSIIPIQGAMAASAKDNYRTYCAQCHGLQGNGQGINVKDMSVQPRNHTDTVYMSSRSDQDLFTADKKGGLAINKSVLMPPWGDTLNNQEIHAMVQYLRKLCHCQEGKQ